MEHCISKDAGQAYTDGSHTEDRNGSDIFNVNPLETTIKEYETDASCCVFRSELTAINYARLRFYVKAVTPKCLSRPPVDRDRLNAYPGSCKMVVRIKPRKFKPRHSGDGNVSASNQLFQLPHHSNENRLSRIIRPVPCERILFKRMGLRKRFFLFLLALKELNLSRNLTSSSWSGVVVRRDGASSGVILVT
ncbi:hypothetical protein TNCV_3715401 [Trichonephila clavipes]|nr:hypothetical protein TNCV_3715401 [Trichonephila clavipes]